MRSRATLPTSASILLILLTLGAFAQPVPEINSDPSGVRIEVHETGRLLAKQVETKEARFVPDGLVIPVGESRSAKIVGAPEGDPQVEVVGQDLVELDWSGGELRLTGRASGQGSLMLHYPGKSIELPFKVRYWAAQLPSHLELELTGDRGFLGLQEALSRALLPYVRMEASVEVKELPVKEGETRKVEVRASGPDLIPRQSTMTLALQKTRATLYPAETLVLSNRPEKITTTGKLLDRDIPAVPMRFLYHHRNMPDNPERFLEVLLLNNSGRDVRVHTVIGSVGPSPDEIHVGHIATLRFAQRSLSGSGQVLTVPAGGSRCIDRLWMKPGQTVSGLAHLQPDGPLRMVVRAVSETEPDSWDYVPDVPGGRTARGLYPAAIKADYSHLVGGRYTYIELGDQPYLEDGQTGEKSPGNFGAIYRIRLLLQNPEPLEREVWMEFVPGGGPARGVVLIENQLLDVAMGRSRTRIPLARWTLQPNETREVFVETLPQSGSNYPVRLVVQSDFAGRAESAPAPTGQVAPTLP